VFAPVSSSSKAGELMKGLQLHECMGWSWYIYLASKFLFFYFPQSAMKISKAKNHLIIIIVLGFKSSSLQTKLKCKMCDLFDLRTVGSVFFRWRSCCGGFREERSYLFAAHYVTYRLISEAVTNDNGDVMFECPDSSFDLNVRNTTHFLLWHAKYDTLISYFFRI